MRGTLSNLDAKVIKNCIMYKNKAVNVVMASTMRMLTLCCVSDVKCWRSRVYF